jgi:archaellum biogenesis ATPase FlaH
MNFNFTEIDNNYEGGVPTGTDLVVVERDDVDNGSFESALVLYGFDEVGNFTENTMQIVNPVYGFLGDK